jgi:orotidine-5'-phosphate decarboxylase
VSGSRQLRARDRLIFGLDVASTREALNLVSRLTGEVGMFKVGKRLFVHAGPDIVRRIRKRGGEIFLDLKFHDIPETVAGAAVEAARLGVYLLNIHAAGGTEMMRHTVAEVDKVCRAERLRRPKLLGVTVLTSLDSADLKSVGVAGGVRRSVTRLAKLALESGMDGVVASAREIEWIRAECGPRFLIVTPGIRPSGSSDDDQKRIATPAAAVGAGADYIVVARPIRDAPDPVAAARGIVASIAEGSRRR